MYFLIDTDLFTRTIELIITCMSKALVHAYTMKRRANEITLNATGDFERRGAGGAVLKFRRL